jgi:hypothetical protein
MSLSAALCPTSLAFLSLSDGDLPNRSQPSPKTKLLERVLDIKLNCNFTFNYQDTRGGQLDVVSWDGGGSVLCGGCTFCYLLLDSLQQELNSKLRKWRSQFRSLPRNFGPFQTEMEISLKRFEYHKDPIPSLARQAVSSWDVHMALMCGCMILPPGVSGEFGLPKQDIEVAFELFREGNDPGPKWLNIHRRPLEASTLSEKNVAKIRTWMEECEKNHHKCWADSPLAGLVGMSQEAYFLPTRLIDVGDPTSDRHPRLINTFQSCVKTNYMALSYCWGSPSDPRLLTTRRETLAARLERIEINIMPQTFRDAVTLARAVDIQYIWIDALCIIQDDPQDWQAESSRMAEIFSNAYLTVIAATGASCHDSFLDRDLLSRQCTLPLGATKPGSFEGHLSLRYRRRPRGSDKMAEINQGRWISRGWTFQEERLARRALIFGRAKFFFDCRSVERSEDTDVYRERPDWVDSVCGRSLVDGVDTTGVANGGSYLNPQHSAYDHWQTLCSHYSFRELTFPVDKLPAFSGMAKRIAKTVRSDYLAGLWKGNLTHDLLWRINGTATKPEK